VDEVKYVENLPLDLIDEEDETFQARLDYDEEEIKALDSSSSFRIVCLKCRCAARALIRRSIRNQHAKGFFTANPYSPSIIIF